MPTVPDTVYGGIRAELDAADAAWALLDLPDARLHLARAFETSVGADVPTDLRDALADLSWKARRLVPHRTDRRSIDAYTTARMWAEFALFLAYEPVDLTWTCPACRAVNDGIDPCVRCGGLR